MQCTQSAMLFYQFHPVLCLSQWRSQILSVRGQVRGPRIEAPKAPSGGGLWGGSIPSTLGVGSGEENFFIFSSVSGVIWCISSVELRR